MGSKAAHDPGAMAAGARALVARDERAAYYEAQRLIARSRARGDAGEAFHWAKVAAEIARIAPGAEMDIDVVRAVVDEQDLTAALSSQQIISQFLISDPDSSRGRVACRRCSP
jgi:hypothetical protein